MYLLVLYVPLRPLGTSWTFWNTFFFPGYPGRAVPLLWSCSFVAAPAGCPSRPVVYQIAAPQTPQAHSVSEFCSLDACGTGVLCYTVVHVLLWYMCSVVHVLLWYMLYWPPVTEVVSFIGASKNLSRLQQRKLVCVQSVLRHSPVSYYSPLQH